MLAAVLENKRAALSPFYTAARRFSRKNAAESLDRCGNLRYNMLLILFLKGVWL